MFNLRPGSHGEILKWLYDLTPPTTPARVGGVEPSMVQISFDRTFGEPWKQLELHNGSCAFSLLRRGEKLWVRAHADIPSFRVCAQL